MAKTFKALFDEHERGEAYWAEWAAVDFAEELQRRMESASPPITRTALAEKLGVSQAYVTKVLRGDGNPTIRSLAKLARAVDSVVRVHLAPVGSYTVWHDVLQGGNTEALTPAGNEVSRLAFPALSTARVNAPVATVTIAAAETSNG